MYDNHNNSNWYIDGKREGKPATLVEAARNMDIAGGNIYWYGNGYNYMTVNNVTAIWKGPVYNIPGSNFTFVKLNSVTKTFKGTPYYTVMPFTKMVNNAPQKVTAVNRNDFYQIFVNIRYNNKLELLEFSVENWNDKNLDIEFN